MKKFIKVLFVIILCLGAVGCSSNETKEEDKVIKVAATLDPHSKILEFAKGILKEKGWDLEIIVLDNYYIFNESLNSKEIDANYFQHLPFFNDEKEKNGYDIVNVAGIHIEPFGFYSKKITDVSEFPENGEIIISNSISDQGRILAILENAGLIKLANDDPTTLTLNDITENSKNIQFKEVNPELLTTVYEEGEGDLVAINGNYALQANLNPVKDAVILENADATNPYVNIVAARSDNQDSEAIKILVEVLTSKEVKEFIKSTYADGSVIPSN
ncbi:MAG: MetQ/NlpA family ABC transporter substrate-binding protein [Anaerorhabdus sp.]